MSRQTIIFAAVLLICCSSFISARQIAQKSNLRNQFGVSAPRKFDGDDFAAQIRFATQFLHLDNIRLFDREETLGQLNVQFKNAHIRGLDRFTVVSEEKTSDGHTWFPTYYYDDIVKMDDIEYLAKVSVSDDPKDDLVVHSTVQGQQFRLKFKRNVLIYIPTITLFYKIESSTPTVNIELWSTEIREVSESLKQEIQKHVQKMVAEQIASVYSTENIRLLNENLKLALESNSVSNDESNDKFNPLKTYWAAFYDKVNTCGIYSTSDRTFDFSLEENGAIVQGSVILTEGKVQGVEYYTWRQCSQGDFDADTSMFHEDEIATYYDIKVTYKGSDYSGKIRFDFTPNFIGKLSDCEDCYPFMKIVKPQSFIETENVSWEWMDFPVAEELNFLPAKMTKISLQIRNAVLQDIINLKAGSQSSLVCA